MKKQMDLCGEEGKEKACEEVFLITLTREQMRVFQNALEEYFRLRMGQDMDFSSEMACIQTDLSPDNPEHRRLFDRYIDRKEALRQVMKAFFGIAFDGGYLKAKTEDMMIAECIWDAVRTARGCNRWGSAMQIGSEPSPKIEIMKSGKTVEKAVE